MHFGATLQEFRNALKNQDKEKILSIMKDQEWWADVVEQNNVLEKCKADTQLAYEYLTLLKILEKRSKTFEPTERSRLSLLKTALHNIVDNSNVDIDLYDMSFLASAKKEKPKQSVLGKLKKEVKKYPNVPTSALTTMDPECWDLDEDVQYFDSSTKRDFKIRMLNEKVTRGQKNEEIKGSYKYILSPKGGLYAMKDSHRRKHSTIRAGQPVIGAGHITVTNGRIVLINADSGHYAPPPKQTLLACMILREQNIIDEYCMVHLEGYRLQSFRTLLVDPMLAELVAACRQTLREDRLPNQEVINKLSTQAALAIPSARPQTQNVAVTFNYLPKNKETEHQPNTQSEVKSTANTPYNVAKKVII